MQQIFANILASLIERSFGNYRLTITGIVAALATSVGAFAPVVPEQYKPYLIAGGAFLGLLAGALGYDKLAS